MPFLLPILLNFQGSAHLFGVGSFSNYVSNYGLDNIDELNREIEVFNRMCDADPDSITQLIFKY